MTSVIAIEGKIPEEKLAEYWYEVRHKVFEELRDAFRHSGLTQDIIAFRLGRDKALISRWLSGRENITLRTMCNIARAMECRLDVGVRPLKDLRTQNYSFVSAHGLGKPYTSPYTSTEEATFVEAQTITDRSRATSSVMVEQKQA